MGSPRSIKASLKLAEGETPAVVGKDRRVAASQADQLPKEQPVRHAVVGVRHVAAEQRGVADHRQATALGDTAHGVEPDEPRSDEHAAGADRLRPLQA